MSPNYIHIWIYIYIYIYICIYIYIHTYINTYIYIYMYTHIYIYPIEIQVDPYQHYRFLQNPYHNSDSTHIQNLKIQTSVYMQQDIYIYVFICIYMYTYTYIYTYINPYIHLNIFIRLWSQRSRYLDICIFVSWFRRWDFLLLHFGGR
jgi:hypothetical protein